MSEGYKPTTYDSNPYRRMADLADMYSEPCLLLAEHIASSADEIRTTSVLYSFDVEQEPLINVYDEESASEVNLPMGSVVLSDNVIDPDGRITSLELAWYQNKISNTYGVFKKRTYSHLENDESRPLQLLAVVRGLRVPVMTITPRPTGDCSFVELEEGVQQFGELMVTPGDLTQEREEVLKATWDLFSQYLSRSRFSNTDDPLPYADLVNMGVVSRVREVLGESDEDVEYILAVAAQLAEKSAALNSERKLPVAAVNCKIERDGVVFPSKLKVEAHKEDGIIRLSSYQDIPGSKSFGTRAYLPTVYLNPASSFPIQFEGATDEAYHAQLVSELRDLFLLMDLS